MTEIVFILDRSGSMEGLEKDTIGGFNSMLEKQKKEKGEAYISTVLFNDTAEVIHDRKPISQIPHLTVEEYYVCGSTALLDAIGNSIRHIGNIHKYARKEDIPERTLFIIITDGFENSSHFYSYKKVKEMINKQKEKYGWEFMFLGANIDAEDEAEKIGIGRSMAVNYKCDKEGTVLNYGVLSDTISYARGCNAPITADWKKKIKEDYEKRKQN